MHASAKILELARVIRNGTNQDVNVVAFLKITQQVQLRQLLTSMQMEPNSLLKDQFTGMNTVVHMNACQLTVKMMKLLVKMISMLT